MARRYAPPYDEPARALQRLSLFRDCEARANRSYTHVKQKAQILVKAMDTPFYSDDRYLDLSFSFSQEDLRDAEKHHAHKIALERLKIENPYFSLEELRLDSTYAWVKRVKLQNHLDGLLQTLFLAKHDLAWRLGYWSHKIEKQNVIQASCGDYEGLSRENIREWIFSADPFPEEVWEKMK